MFKLFRKELKIKHTYYSYMPTHAELYTRMLNGQDVPPGLVNYPMLSYFYKLNEKSISNEDDKATLILNKQHWVDWVWRQHKHLTTPKYIYHVDYALYTGNEYPQLMTKLITSAHKQHRNIVTSIHLDIAQPRNYYWEWCVSLDRFLLNNTNNHVFDYLNIYVDANEVQLTNAWLNTEQYSVYSNVFDVIKACLLNAGLMKVNVLIVKKQSPKTGRPIYTNILNSRFGFGWLLNMHDNGHIHDFTKNSNKLTLVISDDGKTAYIKNCHVWGSYLGRVAKEIEEHWEGRTFHAIEFDSRMIMLPNASKIGDITRHRIELTPPLSLTWTARLSALLPWLRSYAGQ